MWPFKRKPASQGAVRIARLDERAHAGSNALLQKVAELHSRRELLVALNHVDTVSEDALRELHGARRV